MNQTIDSENECSLSAEARDVLTRLSGIYLDAGLPLEAAARSALADYECYFEPDLLCAS